MKVRGNREIFSVGRTQVSITLKNGGVEISVGHPRPWRFLFQPTSFLYIDEVTKKYEVAVGGDKEDV